MYNWRVRHFKPCFNSATVHCYLADCILRLTQVSSIQRGYPQRLLIHLPDPEEGSIIYLPHNPPAYDTEGIIWAATYAAPTHSLSQDMPAFLLCYHGLLEYSQCALSSWRYSQGSMRR
jgi:hypothetical protein